MTRSLESQFERYRKRGDVAALADVFDRTAPEVLRIAMHFATSPADAEELLQETFLTAIRSAESFDGERRLVPWLLGILHNHSRNAARRATRQPDPSSLPGMGRPESVAATEPSDLSQVVARALGTLEEPYRAVLVLHLTHGLGAAAIADVLGRPPATVRSQLARGLAQVRGRLPKSAVLPGLAAVPLGSGLSTVRRVVMTEAKALAVTAPVAGAAVLLLGGLLMTTKTIIIAAAAVALCAIGVGAAFELGYLGDTERDDSSREAALVVEPAEDPEAGLQARGPGADAVLDVDPEPSDIRREGSAGSARVPLDAPIPEGKGSVAGRLVLGDGTPLVGVKVALWGSAVISDVTDADGSFHLHGDWVGTRQVCIRGTHEFDAVVLKAVKMRVNERVDVEIVVDAGHELAGTVRTAADDKPIANNLVVLRRPGALGDDDVQAGYASVHTDAEGRFQFAYLPSGRYSFTVEEEGYLTHQQRIEIAPGVRDIDVRLERARPWTIRWTGLPRDAAGTRVSWRSYGEGNGAGVGTSGAAEVDAAGEMQISAPAPGRYKFVFLASARTQRVEQIVEVPAGVLEPLELAVEQGVRLRGRLLDTQGRPVPDVRVLVGNGDMAKTDSAGAFAVPKVLKPGTQGVWAYAGRSGVRLEDIELKELGAAEVELRLPGTARLRGKVVAEDPRYLSGWLMALGPRIDQRAYIRLEDDGHFDVAHLPAGRFRLQLTLYGCQSVNREVELAAGKTLDLGTLAMPRYPIVPVSITAPVGEKVPQLMFIRVRRSDGAGASDAPQLRKAQGKIVLFGLMPGRYDLTFEPPGFERIERHVTVVAGENPVLELQLRKP